MLLAAKTGHRGRQVASLAGFVGISLAAGAVGSLATAPRIPTWYASLIKPTLNPPNWLFAPVWTTLYVLMGVAAWLVWKKAGTIHERVFSWFWIQLALNTAWSLVFFGSEQPGWGFPVIVLQWSTAAALLLIPYLGWVTFAAYLNFEIWRLNG